MKALIILVGIATIYGGTWSPQHIGQVLYCDTWQTELYYDEKMPPWIALDVSEYQNDNVKCGDDFILYFGNDTRLNAKAYDAGYLYKANTLLGTPVVDVPALHATFDGLDYVTAVNVSAMTRNQDTLSDGF